MDIYTNGVVYYFCWKNLLAVERKYHIIRTCKICIFGFYIYLYSTKLLHGKWLFVYFGITKITASIFNVGENMIFQK